MREHKSGFDWNEVMIWNADGDDVPLTPREDGHLGKFKPYQVVCHKDVSEVATVTGNLEQALCNWIRNADFVFCCFAWLTNFCVCDALASLKRGCQVVVQKEDFLRPDSDHTAKSHRILREKYGRLRCGFSRYDLPSLASNLSVGLDDFVEGVRCAGVSNGDRRRVTPRMHHKFAVACTVTEVEDEYSREVKFRPYSVWTGSFNPTSNGTKSRENAVVIESESVANFFVDEWAKVFAVSEPLDWDSEWIAPEWRIGT